MRPKALWIVPVVLVLVATMAGPASADLGTVETAPGAQVVMVSSEGRTVSAAELASAASDPAAMARVAEAARGPSVALSSQTPDGEASTTSIVGPVDGRYRITNTTAYPSSAVAYLRADGIGSCTGFLVSPDTVLTAAHCLYDFWNSGGWLTGFQVVPGLDRNHLPFASCTIGQAWVPNDWINTGQQRYDFGALKLGCDFRVNPTGPGWFQLFSNTSVSLINRGFFVTGYPGDKFNPQPEMWEDWDTVVWHDVNSMSYNIDMINGQSGAPIHTSGLTSSGTCRNVCAAGINTNNGVNGGPNLGVRFNSMNMGHINFWIGLP